jgi:hypothetical protein
MGETLSVSAVANRTVAEVVQGLCGLTARFGIPTEVLAGPEADPERDTLVRPAPSGWTVIFWPELTLFDDSFYQGLSRELEALIAAAEIYDGGSWSHCLAEGGELLDRFSSAPEDHALGLQDEDAEQARRKWRGNAAVIAARLSVPVEVVSPYLVRHASVPHRQALGGLKGALRWLGLSGQRSEQRAIKAFPDDQFELDNCWVFTDFWRRLGIEYSDDPDTSDRCLRLPVDRLEERLLKVP